MLFQFSLKKTIRESTLCYLSRQNIMNINKTLQGRTGTSARFPVGNRSSGGAGAAKRSRMPHRGCHRQVTGGGQTKVVRPSGPHIRLIPDGGAGAAVSTCSSR